MGGNGLAGRTQPAARPTQSQDVALSGEWVNSTRAPGTWRWLVARWRPEIGASRFPPKPGAGANPGHEAHADGHPPGGHRCLEILRHAHGGGACGDKKYRGSDAEQSSHEK